MSAATKNIRWWDNNGLNQTAFDAGRITFSSEQASFPGENAVNDSRSKVWSPEGNFEITSSNQKIYVESVIGTIPTGFFIPSTLATAIETELNSVDSGWTVTYSSNKFTISNAGSKTLELSITTNAIWDDIGYTGTTDRVGSDFPADEQRNHTDEWIELDFGVETTASCASIISLLSEQFPLTTNATINIQGNNVSLWTAPALEISASRKSRGVFNFFDNLTEVGRTYRKWRIQIIDRLNPLGPTGLKFSRLYIGDHSTTDTNVASGFSKPIVDPTTTQRSESGVAFFNEKVKYQRLQNTLYQVIGESDRVYLEQLYQDFGKSLPLFVSVDPQAGVSVDLSEFTYYGNFDADPTPRNLFRDKWAMQFSFREAV